MDFERTRRRILDAARRLMADRGPESLTVSAVAHAAEINRTTAYQHFRTRDDLVRAVSDELVAEVMRLLADPRPLPERIDFLAHHFLEHPEFARFALQLMLSESPFPREAWERADGRGAQDQRGPRRAGRRRRRDAAPRADGRSPSCGRCTRAASSRTPDAARRATQRLTRELKRLLLYGLFRPERVARARRFARTAAPASARRKRRDP